MRFQQKVNEHLLLFCIKNNKENNVYVAKYNKKLESIQQQKYKLLISQ